MLFRSLTKSQIPEYIMSIDDVSARAERYTSDDKGREDNEIIYPTDGRYMLQILTSEIRKKVRVQKQHRRS